MSFWVKTNYFVKKIFPNYVWDIPNKENKVFLTFDDGPIPEITEWTLEQLKKYDAKATFFCIGNNIEKHPEIFNNIITQGHALGNHTFNHLNGWKNSTEDYIENVKLCQSQITNPKSHPSDSELAQQILNLFRPPYGRIKPSQSRILRKLGYKIIMWDILSYDFDQTITPEKCLDNVLKNVVNGSIIVFHDSEKAEKNLKILLPEYLQFLKSEGYLMKLL